MADDYVKAAITAEQRGSKVTKMGATRTATAAEKEKLKNTLIRINSDLENTKNINEINSQVLKMANTLQDAGVINIQQREKFLKEIRAIENAEDKRKYVRDAIRLGIPVAIGSASVTGAYNFFTK